MIPIWLSHMWHSYMNHKCSQVRKMTFIWYTYMITIYDTHIRLAKRLQVPQTQFIWYTYMIHTYDTHIWYSYTMSKRSQVQEMTFIWYTHMMPIYDTYIRWVKDLHHKYERRHLYDTHIWLSYIDHLIKKMFLHVYDPHMHVPYITLIYEPQMITSTKGHIHMIHTYDTPMWYTHMILIYSYCTNNFIYMIHMWWSHI